MEEHEEHKDEEKVKKRKKRLKKYQRWQIFSAVLAFVVIVLFLRLNNCGSSATGDVVAADVAAEKTINYINSNLGVSATLVGVEEEDFLYNVQIIVEGQNFNSYVTKDGKFLFPQAIDMDVVRRDTATQQQQEDVSGVVKSDKPEVELFVMSHCPFGTQAEKGIIPAVNLLGDKIDFKLRFVYYAMHAEREINEQLKQYCIQEEQEDKFLDYLSCFLADGDSGRCLSEVGIDESKLDSCVEETDEQFGVTAKFNDQSTWLSGRYPLFDIDKELNEKYGIGGSPTLVINGEQASSSRNPRAYLSTICAAFNEAPEECSEQLSSQTPSSGFGYGAGGADAGSCG